MPEHVKGLLLDSCPGSLPEIESPGWIKVYRQPPTLVSKQYTSPIELSLTLPNHFSFGLLWMAAGVLSAIATAHFQLPGLFESCRSREL